MFGLKRVPIAIAATLIAFTLAAGNAGAQGISLDTVIARFLAASADHPAAIVAGSCSTADARAAFKLDDVKAGKTKTGDAAALAASWSETTIAAKFADLVKNPYSLVVAGGTKDPATVACGAITGTPIGDTLAFTIRPVGTSRDAGVAWLRQDGDKTSVTVLFASGIVPQMQQPANAKQAPVTSTTPTSYQASVYQGTCANPGTSSAFSLTALGMPSPTTGTPAAGSTTTATTPHAVVMSTTTISTKLQNLLKNPYVITIQPAQNASSQTKPLACGAIGGEMSGNDLAFALGSANSSSDVAFAWLQENGDKTDVTLFLIPNPTA